MGLQTTAENRQWLCRRDVVWQTVPNATYQIREAATGKARSPYVPTTRRTYGIEQQRVGYVDFFLNLHGNLHTHAAALDCSRWSRKVAIIRIIHVQSGTDTQHSRVDYNCLPFSLPVTQGTACRVQRAGWSEYFVVSLMSSLELRLHGIGHQRVGYVFFFCRAGGRHCEMMAFRAFSCL